MAAASTAAAVAVAAAATASLSPPPAQCVDRHDTRTVVRDELRIQDARTLGRHTLFPYIPEPNASGFMTVPTGKTVVHKIYW